MQQKVEEVSGEMVFFFLNIMVFEKNSYSRF